MAARGDKRQRIIDAAIEVFAEKGFFGARVSEIAHAAGVADGTIYRYFEKKDDILISLFREKMGEIVHRLSALAGGEDDPETKIRRYIAEHLALVADKPKLMHVLTVELRQSAQFMKEYSLLPFGRYLAVLSGIIEEGQAAGVFRQEVHAPTISRAMFGALDQISLSWVLSPGSGRTDRAAVAEQLGEFFLRGLRASEFASGA